VDTDVCVVGGGPAGLALALMLLRSGVRVAVVERARSFEREYRGEILQPGGLRVLDELGVLDAARRRGGYELTAFRLVDRGRTLLDIDYRRLAGPYNFLLSIPQRHVLEELLAAAQDCAGFQYAGGTRATGLHREGHRICGVSAVGPDGPLEITARYVVGADGRQSRVRREAGIPYQRLEAFDFDVLWFRLPEPRSTADGAPPADVRIVRGEGRPVLVYPSYPDAVQIGWTLPHRSYRQWSARGIEAIRAEIARALPAYADRVEAELTKLTDLTLLDVFAGCAERWTGDGLMLIGDSAHTHSPLGAQGINLALQDAAIAHPVLVDAVRAGGSGDLTAFERRRRPDIDLVMKIQRMQSKGMVSAGGLADRVRPAVTRVLTRTPMGAKVTGAIAHGRRPVGVASHLFTDRRTAGEPTC
jgi:monooxygenase